MIHSKSDRKSIQTAQCACTVPVLCLSFLFYFFFYFFLLLLLPLGTALSSMPASGLYGVGKDLWWPQTPVSSAFLYLSLVQQTERTSWEKTKTLVGDLIQDNGKNSAPERPSARLSGTNEH